MSSTVGRRAGEYDGLKHRNEWQKFESIKGNTMARTHQHELLERLAYQSWLDRGQPIGSPEVDWNRALQQCNSIASRDEQPSFHDHNDACRAPIVNDAVAAPLATSGKARRNRAAGTAKRSTAPTLTETPPLEVPPTSPAPPPPTPTQAATA